jgi:hypothetical protein
VTCGLLLWSNKIREVETFFPLPKLDEIEEDIK